MSETLPPRSPADISVRRDERAPARGAATVRARLRAETRSAHERLDASFAGLAEGEAADYGLFLRVNEACLGAIEPVLATSPLARAIPAAVAGGRQAAALADLGALGLRQLALPPFPIGRPTLAQGVGIAYVLEGSRLGARLILKRLRAARAETDRPLAALFLETAGSVDRFRAFLDAAEALLDPSKDGDAAVGAADATFGYFLDAVRLADGGRDGGGGAN